MNEEKLVVFQFDYLRMIYYTINKNQSRNYVAEGLFLYLDMWISTMPRSD